MIRRWLAWVAENRPRLMWQFGISWRPGEPVEWGYILERWDADIFACELEAMDGEMEFVWRRVWMSRAKLESLGEFPGW